ncbi:hypothetical protein QE250_13140 [Chromatiaceae bacterium AAb-1]|nr:hypothetical protein [Chromatiaceae bacterium AAb-1]
MQLSRICNLALIPAASLMLCFTAVTAQAGEQIQLIQQSHVCNDETEIQRLSENESLQEMARALVEFKATKYCFILEPAAVVTVLEKNPAYIKFSYQSQVLYTFSKYTQTL